MSVSDEVKQETEEAIARVDAAADEEWKMAAKFELFELARRQREFTASDLMTAMLQRPEKTRDNRAIGAIIRWGMKRALMVRTGQYVPSEYSHSRPVPVWRSLIYHV